MMHVNYLQRKKNEWEKKQKKTKNHNQEEVQEINVENTNNFF